MNKVGFILGKMLAVLVGGVSALLLVCLVRLQMLPVEMLVVSGVLLALLTALVLVLTWSGRGKVRMTFGIILAVLLIAGLSFGTVYLWHTLNTLDSITGGNTETVHVGIYVRSDDTRDFDKEAAGYLYGILETIDRENTDGALQQLNEKLEKQVSCQSYSRITELVDALLDKEVDAIVLNQAFLSMLEDMGYAEKLTQLREAVLKQVEVQIDPPPATEPTTPTGNGEVPDDKPKSSAFTIYISGIDTAGKVSVVSRSDVNIIAVVNPDTKQILLVSTPRDYFVPLSNSNGVRDKLTHAGNHGVNVSKDTLGMLYDMDIDYYFKINFSGFKEIVDALGGITVYSEHAFGDHRYSFKKGANELDGDAALAFCRDRYSFADGDHQRGRNQMAVIKGVVDKAMSPALLTNYIQVLDAVKDNFKMNVPMEVISAVVSRQLSDGGSWNVVSYSVSGTGDYQPTPWGPEKLWVMWPDYETVDYAKQLIRDVMDGKVVEP